MPDPKPKNEIPLRRFVEYLEVAREKLKEADTELLAAVAFHKALHGKSDPPKPSPGLRPEVLAFAHAMEAQLRANDHKPGWKQDNPWALLKRLHEEADELEVAVNEMEPKNLGTLRNEAADVGNFAMMIADVCGGLKTEPPKPDPQPIAEMFPRFVFEDNLRRDPDFDKMCCEYAKEGVLAFHRFMFRDMILFNAERIPTIPASELLRWLHEHSAITDRIIAEAKNKKPDPQPDGEVVEKVARAIAKSNEQEFPSASRSTDGRYVGNAEAAISAMREAGWGPVAKTMQERDEARREVIEDVVEVLHPFLLGLRECDAEAMLDAIRALKREEKK